MTNVSEDIEEDNNFLEEAVCRLFNSIMSFFGLSTTTRSWKICVSNPFNYKKIDSDRHYSTFVCDPSIISLL